MMIISKLINSIKQSLESTTDKEKITSDIGYKKISKIFGGEFLLLGTFVAFYAAFFVFYIFFVGFFWVASPLFTLISASLISFFKVIIDIFPFVIVILFLVNIFRIYKIKTILKLSTTPEYLSTEEYKKFNKKCTVIYIFNSLIIFIITFIIIFNYTNITNSYGADLMDLKEVFVNP